jgi:hypothetical protein
VKKLTRLWSRSRNNNERLPHGMVVGAWTTSSIVPSRRSYSASMSSTRNSMIAEWFFAALATPVPNRARVRSAAIARVNVQSGAVTGPYGR